MHLRYASPSAGKERSLGPTAANGVSTGALVLAVVKEKMFALRRVQRWCSQAGIARLRAAAKASNVLQAGDTAVHETLKLEAV